MILNRKHFSLLVQVIDRGHLNTTGDYAEGKVLDSLEYLKKFGEVLGNQMGAALRILIWGKAWMTKDLTRALNLN